MAFPSFDQFWSEAASRAGLEQKAKEYYGRILQYYIEEQGNISPSIRWEAEATAGPYGAKGAWEVKDHTGNSIGAWQTREQAEDAYNKAMDGWESNTYLGRAHRELEEDMERSDIDIQATLKQYETTIGGIAGKEESKKLAYDAMMKDYLRQRGQFTSELALNQATTKTDWENWQTEEQNEWKSKKKELYTNLAKSGGRGGIAQEQFGTASTSRYGTIGGKSTAYNQALEQLQLGFTGQIGSVAHQEEMEQLAYQEALKDFQQQRAEATLRKDIDTTSEESKKKFAESLYGWELGRTGIEERQKRRELAEQLKAFVDQGVSTSQATSLAQYTATRGQYEQGVTNTGATY